MRKRSIAVLSATALGTVALTAVPGLAATKTQTNSDSPDNPVAVSSTLDPDGTIHSSVNIKGPGPFGPEDLSVPAGNLAVKWRLAYLPTDAKAGTKWQWCGPESAVSRSTAPSATFTADGSAYPNAAAPPRCGDGFYQVVTSGAAYIPANGPWRAVLNVYSGYEALAQTTATVDPNMAALNAATNAAKAALNANPANSTKAAQQAADIAAKNNPINSSDAKAKQAATDLVQDLAKAPKPTLSLSPLNLAKPAGK